MQGSIGTRIAGMAAGTAVTSDIDIAPDVTANPSPRASTHDISTALSRDDAIARLTEMREWHMGKASASWSYETKERHERFAEWLNVLEAQYQSR